MLELYRERITVLPIRNELPFQNSLPREQLRNHKMAYILIGPVRQMACDCDQDRRFVEDAPTAISKIQALKRARMPKCEVV